MLADLPKALFAANLNTQFRMTLEDSTVIDLELIEVVDRKSTPKQEQFSLIFRAPPESPVGQGTVKLEHYSLESGELFLVPVARDDKGSYYQAVFNRLL